jgi:hypothetical protein
MPGMKIYVLVFVSLGVRFSLRVWKGCDYFLNDERQI